MRSLEDYLSARRVEIEQALDQHLSADGGAPPLVLEAMRYSVFAGGKRLRPILTLASAEAVAERRQVPHHQARAQAMPAACAVEMIHTYSLIHDDLPAMDDDALRRGRPTLHVVYGEGMAILAGDALLTEAFAVLAREPHARDAVLAARQLQVIGRIAAAAGSAGMVGGQAIDLAAVRPVPGRPSPALDAEAIGGMHARKTGAMIRVSAVAGAIMADADAAEIAGIDAYGREIGLAFQIVDDILDVEGVTAALGKTAGKDVAAGKPTFPSLYGVEQSRALASACRDRADAALATIGLTHSRLGEIADWVVRRQS